MVPDVMVLCVMVAFGLNVAQRVHHVIRHDHGSLLRSIYKKTGLLLDTLILGLQGVCESPPAWTLMRTTPKWFGNTHSHAFSVNASLPASRHAYT